MAIPIYSPRGAWPMVASGKHSTVRPWLRLAVAGFLCVPLGVMLAAFANDAARRGAAGAGPLFWTALILVFAPAGAVLWSDTLSRGQSVTLLLMVGLGLYAIKALHSPGLFTGYDELLHLRTLENISQTGRLFGRNPLLPVSPYYPGLELVTHSLMGATGLGPIQAGLIVIGAARAFFVVSLFLFFERVARPARLAGLATLLYMTAPSFINFDAAFAYESLALPLSVFSLFVLRQAQAEEGTRRHLLNAVAGLAVLAVVVTHHVTSFILAGALVLWTAATLLVRKAPREPLPGGGWVPALAVLAIAGWLSEVATATVGYLAPHATAAMQEALRIMAGEGLGRRLFESVGSGVSAPLLERVVGIGSVLLIVAILPFGVLYLRKQQWAEVLPRLLVFGALLYPAVMLLRFTRSGWEVGSRAMAFICVPLAFVLAAGIEQVRVPFAPRLWRRSVMAAAILVVFLGGVIAGTSPLNRLPRPYAPGAYNASIEGEGIAAATWARTILGTGGRMVGDSTNSSLMGSYGGQDVLSSSDHVSVSGMFLLPFGDYQRDMILKRRIQYVVVDRRIAGAQPLAGFFYEKWERQVFDYGATIDPWMLSRYDELADADRIFDSGEIQIYDVRRLGR